MIKVAKKIQPGSSKYVEPTNSSSFISFCLMFGVTFLSCGGCRHQWENSIKPTGKLRKNPPPPKSNELILPLCPLPLHFYHLLPFHSLSLTLVHPSNICKKEELMVDWINACKPAATLSASLSVYEKYLCLKPNLHYCCIYLILDPHAVATINQQHPHLQESWGDSMRLYFNHGSAGSQIVIKQKKKKKTTLSSRQFRKTWTQVREKAYLLRTVKAETDACA